MLAGIAVHEACLVLAALRSIVFMQSAMSEINCSVGDMSIISACIDECNANLNC